MTGFRNTSLLNYNILFSGNFVRFENDKDCSGDESDNEFLFNTTNKDESSEHMVDSANNDTSCYYADESSKCLYATELDNVDLESSLIDASNGSTLQPTYFNYPVKEKHLNGDNKRIEKGSCAAC